MTWDKVATMVSFSEFKNLPVVNFTFNEREKGVIDLIVTFVNPDEVEPSEVQRENTTDNGVTYREGSF